MTVLDEICFWAADIVPLLACLGTFIYGINNFTKKGKAYYLQIVTMAFGCYAMGSFYTVVKSLYNDEKVYIKPGDTNGYSGKEWNAIYFTKSYEAGKCMTSTGYFIDSADNFGKYTPVAAFGAKNCFDPNSFNDNENTENV